MPKKQRPTWPSAEVRAEMDLYSARCCEPARPRLVLIEDPLMAVVFPRLEDADEWIEENAVEAYDTSDIMPLPETDWVRVIPIFTPDEALEVLNDGTEDDGDFGL